DRHSFDSERQSVGEFVRQELLQRRIVNEPVAGHRLRPHHRDRPTSAGNGLGECERCNYAKEASGWRVTGGTDENGVRTTEFVTPTRHRYRSTAPPAPGPIQVHVSEVELRIGVSLAECDAA